MPPNRNKMGGRFFLAIKDRGTDREIRKVRFLINGCKGKLKKVLVQKKLNVRLTSFRLLVA